MSEEATAPEGADESAVVTSEAPAEATPVETPAEKPEAIRAERDRSRSAELTDSLKKSFDKVLKVPKAEAETPAEAQGQPRAPDGKFAPKAEMEAPAVSVPPAPPVVPEPQVAPPSWLRDDAKIEWGKTSHAVREEVARRFGELENGLNEYKRQFEPLKQFSEMAKQSGTDLPTALQNYTGIEQTLRQNPVKGFEQIARNLNIDLRKFAEWYIAQPQKSPEQMRAEQLQEQAERQIAEARRMQEQTAQGMIESFAAAHPRFNELSEAIAFALNTGKAQDLASAYEYADRLIPAASAAPQTPATPPAAQTRSPAPQTGNPSLYGAPGSNPKPPPAKSVDEAIRRSAAKLGLSI